LCSIYRNILNIWRAGKTHYSAARWSPKTDSPSQNQQSNVEPKVLVTGSRRRPVVGCLYVGLCVVHGGPLLFSVFFTLVRVIVHDDVRQATVTLDSIKVIISRPTFVAYLSLQCPKCYNCP